MFGKVLEGCSGKAAAGVFAFWSAAYVLKAHLPYILHANEQNIDEGYLLAIGQRMLEGRLLPFVDGVAHSGPLFLLSAAPIAAMGEFSWLPIRIVAAACFVAMSGLTWLVGRQAGHPVAGAIGAASLPLFCVLRSAPFDGMAYNAEVPVNLFILGSLCCLAALSTSTGRLSSRWAVAVGFLAALAGLSKQIGILQSSVLGAAFLLVVTGSPRADWKKLRLAVGFGVGAAAPCIVLLAWYLVNGAVSDLWYYVVTYNSDIYMHFATTSRLELFGRWLFEKPTETAAGIGVVSWGLANTLLRSSTPEGLRPSRGWFPATLCGLAITGIIGARASQRDFDHYYNIAVPWFGLLVGLIGESAIAGLRGRWGVVGRVVLLAPIVICFEVMWAYKSRNLLGWTGRNVAPLAAVSPAPRVCEVIQQHTPEGRPTFVWGFRPGLHVSCKRRPASRFVFSTVVSGYVPWHTASTKVDEDRLTVPGSRELLISELEAAKPPIIVDDGNWSLHGRPMSRYEILAQYVASHYRLISDVDGMLIYLRRDG